MSIFGFIKGVIQPARDIFDEAHFSGEEKAAAELALAELEVKVAERILELRMQALELQAGIIHAESTGGKLQRNWRPLLMLSFMLILVNNYILLPYGPVVENIFGLDPGTIVLLDFPAGFWSLLTVGVGGYITSRGVEKGLSEWRRGKNGESGKEKEA